MSLSAPSPSLATEDTILMASATWISKSRLSRGVRGEGGKGGVALARMNCHKNIAIYLDIMQPPSSKRFYRPVYSNVACGEAMLTLSEVKSRGV